MLPLIGSIIGAGASLLGSAMNNSAQKQANEQNAAAQKEFAQHGIRWKVRDAQKAGVHPLYALGAQTTQFSPSYVGGSPGDGISQAGQEIGRAVSSTLTQPEKAFNDTVQKLQLERGALENELLRSQIQRERVGTMAMGTPVVGRTPKGGELMFHGNSWDTNPGTSNAQDVEDRYGDLVSSLYGVGVIGSDVLYNRPSASGAATPGRTWIDNYNEWAAKTRLREYLKNPRRVGDEVYKGIY